MKFIAATLVALCLCASSSAAAQETDHAKLHAKLQSEIYDSEHLLAKIHEMEYLLDEKKDRAIKTCPGEVLPPSDVPVVQCLIGERTIEVYTAWYDKTGTLGEVTVENFAFATLKNLKFFYDEPRIETTKAGTKVFTWQVKGHIVALRIRQNGTTMLSLESLTTLLDD